MKTNRIAYALASLLILGCAERREEGETTATERELTYIKICSFNIAEIGNPNRDKDHSAIAQLINGFDLIVVQEVQDRGGADEIRAIHDSLNSIAATPYSEPLVISGAGRGFPGNEGYAFIYRDPVSIDDRFTPTDDFRHDDHSTYGRIPALVHFTAGKFDFVVASLHLAWGNKDRRKNEVTDVKEWLIEFSERPETEEKDLIVLGDVNRYGDYSQTAIGQHQTAFDILVDTDHLGTAYRLLLCELLPAVDTRFAASDSQSTTVAASKNLYDQIWISSGAFREFETDPAVFGESVGIIPFDMESPWVDMNHGEIKGAISDHRPIWARFWIDMEDDDEPILE